MAIQMRRGEYAQFDPSRMLPGEWAVVLSGDSDATDGRTAYICFAAGDVKRVLTEGEADYSLAIDGRTVRLVHGAGDSEVTVPDSDTRYGLAIDGRTIRLVSGGSTDSVTVPDDDTTYAVATSTEAGLMSAADKKRLDGLSGLTWGQL